MGITVVFQLYHLMYNPCLCTLVVSFKCSLLEPCHTSVFSLPKWQFLAGNTLCLASQSWFASDDIPIDTAACFFEATEWQCGPTLNTEIFIWVAVWSHSKHWNFKVPVNRDVRVRCSFSFEVGHPPQWYSGLGARPANPQVTGSNASWSSRIFNENENAWGTCA